MKRLVSFSGGKDSTATLLLALERHDKSEVMVCFADTGNEHDIVYEYLDYVEKKTGVYIHRVKADFSDRWESRIAYVRDKWPDKMRNPKPKNIGTKENPIYEPVKPWSEDAIDRIVTNALSVLEKGQTGNPFLDLCILKGRFPSRMAQFCTQELKVIPLTEYTLELIDKHGAVESWQGVRANESASRAKLPEREDKGGGLTIYRPIHTWTVDDVFAIHKKYNVDPNPLYLQGAGRVGCMPCVNCSKGELFNIWNRFHEHIERIAEWEKIVSLVSRRESATFFEASGYTNEESFERGNIIERVKWSMTKRGGKEYDFDKLQEDTPACSSSYGLCE